MKFLRFKPEKKETDGFIVTWHFETDNTVTTCGLQLTKQIIWLHLYGYVDIVNTVQTDPNNRVFWNLLQQNKPYNYIFMLVTARQ